MADGSGRPGAEERPWIVDSVPGGALTGSDVRVGWSRPGRLRLASAVRERERTFPTRTYLSPILLGVNLSKMGEKYVHATKVRSRWSPSSPPALRVAQSTSRGFAIRANL